VIALSTVSILSLALKPHRRLADHIIIRKVTTEHRLPRFGGLDVSEAKRLRALEDENTRLKRLLADSMLDNAALKDLLGKKW
jgi:hypothetical protein